MTRLINDMRASIINGMMQHAFAERALMLMGRQAILAAEIYKDLYNHKQHAILDTAPEGFFPKSEGLLVQIAGQAEYCKQFKFNGQLEGYSYTGRNAGEPDIFAVLKKEDRSPDEIRQRVAYKHHKGNIDKLYDADSPLGMLIIKWIDDKKALAGEIAEAHKLATATMDAFTTVEKLVEGWPETAPFAKQYKPPEPIKLPAIPIDKLNGMLGLPVAE